MRNAHAHHPHVIFTGSPISGMQVFGPFPAWDDVVEWANRMEFRHWWEAPLQPAEGRDSEEPADSSAENHVVLTGNPLVGIQCYGPFALHEEAEQWAEPIEDVDWWIALLSMPPRTRRTRHWGGWKTPFQALIALQSPRH